MKTQLIIPYDEEILSIQKARQLPYYQKLIQIRRALELYSSPFPYRFPNEHCTSAARVVSLITGLEEIAGNYTARLFMGERLHSPHSWNLDKKSDLYVDLTQDQFLLTLPGIVILPRATGILEQTEERTRGQRSIEDSFLRIDKILKRIEKK